MAAVRAGECVVVYPEGTFYSRVTVDDIPEIVEFYRMSGDIDYLLRVVVPDVQSYDAVYKRLVKGIELSGVSSSFAMEQSKWTTALPLDYIPLSKS